MTIDRFPAVPGKTSLEFHNFAGDKNNTKSVHRVNDTTQATVIKDVSGEALTFSAGAAGTTGTVMIAYSPVYDANGANIGGISSTSFAFVTGTVLTTEVEYNSLKSDTVQLAALSNGEYAIDYDTGKILYCKATTGTTDTCNYKYRAQEINISASTVEIGDVGINEIQNTDIVAENTAAPGTDYPLPIGGTYNAAAPTLDDADRGVFQQNIAGELKTQILPSTAGNIVVGKAKGAYSFDASAQQVTITGFESLNLEDVTMIINQTDNIIIFAEGVPGLGGTISSNVVTTTFDTTGMADADKLTVYVKNNATIDFDQNAQLTLNQNPPWSRYTTPEAYTTLAPDDTTYDEGAVIPCAGYNTVNLFYSKTASDADNSYIKVIYLITSDSAVDYQELSFGSPAAGVTVLSANVYERDKAALVEMLPIPTNGAPYMRIDIAKKTDTGTDSTFTTYINKAYI